MANRLNDAGLDVVFKRVLAGEVWCLHLRQKITFQNKQKYVKKLKKHIRPGFGCPRVLLAQINKIDNNYLGSGFNPLVGTNKK